MINICLFIFHSTTKCNLSCTSLSHSWKYVCIQTSTLPPLQAYMSGVLPYLLAALTSAPFSTRYMVSSKCLLAKIRQVEPIRKASRVYCEYWHSYYLSKNHLVSSACYLADEKEWMHVWINGQSLHTIHIQACVDNSRINCHHLLKKRNCRLQVPSNHQLLQLLLLIIWHFCNFLLLCWMFRINDLLWWILSFCLRSLFLSCLPLCFIRHVLVCYILFV